MNVLLEFGMTSMLWTVALLLARTLPVLLRLLRLLLRFLTLFDHGDEAAEIRSTGPFVCRSPGCVVAWVLLPLDFKSFLFLVQQLIISNALDVIEIIYLGT